MNAMMCPSCGQKNTTGQIGSKQYYCWSCLIEYQIDSNSEVKLFSIEEDGSLVELNKLEGSAAYGTRPK